MKARYYCVYDSQGKAIGSGRVAFRAWWDAFNTIYIGSLPLYSFSDIIEGPALVKMAKRLGFVCRLHKPKGAQE